MTTEPTKQEKVVNLPKTKFPMKAGLPTLEISILLKNPWSSTNDSNNSCIVHDGPPYANGNIHVGHAYNKILKDVLVRYLTLLDGKQPHFVCGWDCHGLPIELAVKKENKSVDAKDLNVFRAYALKQVEKQKEQFSKLGIIVNDQYTTMESSFEDEELKAFQTLVKKGLVETRFKPVQWCWSCETSLAESELGYEEVEDTSVYVLFPLRDFQRTYFMIWTTTPWTLRANRAIAYNPEIQYVSVVLGRDPKDGSVLRTGIVSELFATKNNLEIISKVDSQFFNDNCYDDCLEDDCFGDEDRESTRKLMPASYVSETSGTGLVHIAPSCGKEDYLSFLESFPEQRETIKSATNSKGVIEGGLHVTKENKHNIELLKAVNRLWKEEPCKHNYPHCWRCHNPTIQRATKQVFLDYSSKRNMILEQAEKIKFFPENSKTRFKSFVLSRTEWCLSRQRTWGVPIPQYHCNDCSKHLFDLDVQTVEQWRNIDYKPTCFDCGGNNTTKGVDILDVWFDSGLTYKTLPKKYSEWVVEGSDQHRGWFQSSHILSCLLEEQTCLVNVISHGFVLDEQGRKMSKSLGNVIDPLDVAKQKGIEILRLWTVAQEVGQDVTIGETSLVAQGNTYRKIRNTLRYLHGNLYDFKSEDHSKVEPDPEELRNLQALEKLFHQSFQNIEYYKFIQGLMRWLDSFSAGYMESSKKVLYENAPDCEERRTIQKTYERTLTSLVEMLQVVLPFTIHELNEYRMVEKCQ